jgi:MarR family transcriptional regulator, 2-MHQ and catechol-resistance regulon repressor
MGERTGEERALKLWVVLSRAYSAVEARVKADIARHGLTPAEFGALEALYHKGPMLVGEVKRKILLSSGGITYVIDRLEEKGLVERRDAPGDRRASCAALTPAGEALVARIFPEHAARIEEVLASLSEEEQVFATDLLRRVGRRAAGLGEPG